MKHISWLNLVGGLIALVMAVAYFMGLAYLIGAIPLYVAMGIGVVLMIWDLIISTGETADKREAEQGRKEAANGR